MSPRRFGTAGVLALAVVATACRTSAGVACPPPPAILDCPEAGAPSFDGDVYPNVFVAVCGRCHSPGGEEESMPFTSYAQIYGKNGAEAREIFNQVFESCLMPPSNAPEALSDGQRQTLLDWFACGLPDSRAVDAGAGN